MILFFSVLGQNQRTWTKIDKVQERMGENDTINTMEQLCSTPMCPLHSLYSTASVVGIDDGNYVIINCHWNAVHQTERELKAKCNGKTRKFKRNERFLANELRWMFNFLFEPKKCTNYFTCKHSRSRFCRKSTRVHTLTYTVHCTPTAISIFIESKTFLMSLFSKEIFLSIVFVRVNSSTGVDTFNICVNRKVNSTNRDGVFGITSFHFFLYFHCCCPAWKWLNRQNFSIFSVKYHCWHCRRRCHRLLFRFIVMDLRCKKLS